MTFFFENQVKYHLLIYNLTNMASYSENPCSNCNEHIVRWINDENGLCDVCGFKNLDELENPTRFLRTCNTCKKGKDGRFFPKQNQCSKCFHREYERDNSQVESRLDFYYKNTIEFVGFLIKTIVLSTGFMACILFIASFVKLFYELPF